MCMYILVFSEEAKLLPLPDRIEYNIFSNGGKDTYV